MKNSFKSFEIPESKTIESAWRHDKTLFVFDTNVLLNLYGYEKNTRQEFFTILEEIKSKIWIPHQVGLEYHRRRLDVIKSEKKLFREITGELSKIPQEIEKKLNNPALNKKFPELGSHLKSLIDSIKKEVLACNKKIQVWDKLQPDVRSKDEILDKIDFITDGRIGPQPENQEWLNNLYLEGAERYKKELPPGFCDTPKADGPPEKATFVYNDLTYERQYGDLILWKQILNKASEEEVDNVIFITDDTKKDWWHKMDSGGEKIIGPHEGLKSEIYRDTKISLFHMYTSSTFLEDSNKILKINISNSSIKDVQDKNKLLLDLDKQTPYLNASKLRSLDVFLKENSLSGYNAPESYHSISDELSNSLSTSAIENWKKGKTPKPVILNDEYLPKNNHDIIRFREDYQKPITLDPREHRRVLRALESRKVYEDLKSMQMLGIPVNYENYKDFFEAEEIRERERLQEQQLPRKEEPES